MRRTISTALLLATAFFLGVAALSAYRGVQSVSAGGEGFPDSLKQVVQAPSGEQQSEMEESEESTGPGTTLDFPKRIYDRVSESVVYISTKSVSIERNLFFPFPQRRTEEGVGSGFIISDDGFVLTNAHVVSGADQIEVILADGSSYDAELVGSDPGTDIALLKIGDGSESFPAATVAESDDVEPGDWVAAIGNPFGLDRTITVGVVSALDRSIQSRQGQYIRGLIQTDAAINRGNSGGPLLNTEGEVIGVNTAIVSQSGGSSGVGLAIPISLAENIVKELRREGRVVRPWLGVEVEEVSPPIAERYNFPVDHGLGVVGVYEGSPAAQAGLTEPYVDRRTGEPVYYIITQVDGQQVNSLSQLQSVIRSKDPGSTVNLTVYESGEQIEMSVALEEMPEEAYRAAPRLASL